MKHFVRKYRIALAVLVLLLPIPVAMRSDRAAAVRGDLSAYRDLAAGHPRYLVHGMPFPEISEYKQILKERYGIEAVVVAGCTSFYPQGDYYDGYDRVIRSHVNNKFGRDVFDEVTFEAAKLWETRTAQAAHDAPR